MRRDGPVESESGLKWAGMQPQKKVPSVCSLKNNMAQMSEWTFAPGTLVPLAFDRLGGSSAKTCKFLKTPSPR